LRGLLVAAAAQAYKRVLEKGTTDYGERSPPGAKAQNAEQRLVVRPVGWPKIAQFRG
jgi:hypothetical protein